MTILINAKLKLAVNIFYCSRQLINLLAANKSCQHKPNRARVRESFYLASLFRNTNNNLVKRAYLGVLVIKLLNTKDRNNLYGFLKEAAFHRNQYICN